MKPFIPMSAKELRSFEVIQQVVGNRLKQVEAAALLDVSDRTIRRWIKAVRAKGATGLIHGNRGKASPRRVPRKERNRIVSLVATRYPDFTPTFAAEKLAELHGVVRDPKTIRSLMIDEGLWAPRAKRNGAIRPVHREWRERRAHRGELVQFDGSYHDWFEGRGGIHEACLLAAIDDATGTILHLAFAPHEGTLPVMAFWTEYAGRNGLPKAVYLDRFSTYKMTQQTAVLNPDLKTQLERAMKTLGVDLIFALSPQAKGRVERLFKTLQDRLVKELRLRAISDVRRANQFLEQTFISSFNKKYRVEPREPADFHRQISMREFKELPEVLCRLETRRVMNDFTVSVKSQWYQLLPTPGLAIRPKDEVLVREYPDERLSFSIRNKRTVVKPIAKRTLTRSPERPRISTLVPA